MKPTLDPMMLRTESFEAVLRAAAEAGYSSMEWSPRVDFLPAGERPQTSADLVRRLREAAMAHGVGIAALAAFYNWSSPDPDTRLTAVEWFQQALEVADQLGCRRISTELKGDSQSPGASEAAFWHSAEALLPIAERYGIRISVEPHPGDFIESSDRAVDLVRTAGSNALGYLLCAPHAFIMGGELEAMIRYAGSSITHVHVADTFKPSQIITNPPSPGIRLHQHLDLGLGEVNWDGFFRGLQTVGYSDLVTVAVFAHPERARQSFALNLAKVDALLDGANPRPR